MSEVATIFCCHYEAKETVSKLCESDVAVNIMLSEISEAETIWKMRVIKIFYSVSIVLRLLS